MPESITGAAGQPITMIALGGSRGELSYTIGDERVMRFDLLGVDGSSVDVAQVTSVTVRVRVAAGGGVPVLELPATQEDFVGSDSVLYRWRADLTTLSTTGRWSLEVAVLFNDGVDTVWPQPGTFVVRVREAV